MASAQRRTIQRIFPPASSRRYRAGLLPDTLNEWGLLYSSVADVAGTSDELVTLAAHAALAALAVDSRPLAARFPADQGDVATHWPGEHYRLLTALADVWNAHRVVEIGTFRGASALSFLQAPSVQRVITYDIVPWSDLDDTLLTPADFGDRLEQRVGDVSNANVFAAATEALVGADLIFVDAPKDGVFEQSFLPALLALPVTRPQLVVLDDVRLMPMISLWRSVPLPKLDIGSFGHFSGTGLIIRAEPVRWTAPPAAMSPTWRRRRRGDPDGS